MKSLLLTLGLLLASLPAHALTPQDLTAAELAAYNKVSSDPAASASFLMTRAHVRSASAAAAVALKLEAPKGFDAKHLLPGEEKALAAAAAFGRHAVAAGWAKGFPASIPGEEDPAAAASYRATREYVKKAEAVVAAPDDKKLALDFKRPDNFAKRYLLKGDAEIINAAVKLSLAALAEALYSPEKKQ